MKHAISSVSYITAMKGFTHGASRQPLDPAHSDCIEYTQGYVDGQRARRKYSDELCKKWNLDNPAITAQ